MTVAVCLVRMNIDVLGIDGPVIWSQGQSIGPLFLPCGNKLIYEDLKAIERRMDIKVKCLPCSVYRSMCITTTSYYDQSIFWI